MSNAVTSFLEVYSVKFVDFLIDVVGSKKIHVIQIVKLFSLFCELGLHLSVKLHLCVAVK